MSCAVPIATRYPPRNVMFEMHNINERFRYANGYFDLVHGRSISMAVSLYIPPYSRSFLTSTSGSRLQFTGNRNRTRPPPWRTVRGV